MKTSVYQIVTDKIVEQLAKGVIPWQKPWRGGAFSFAAINYVSRKPYSFLNQFLLGKAGEWLTFKQVQSLGGKIKKGAKSSYVVYSAPIKKKDEEEENEQEKKCVPFVLRYYNVFHIDDCEGIESKIVKEEQKEELQPIEKAESIISDYLSRESGLKFQNDKPSGDAYYMPATDEVIIPMLSQYDIVEEYYSTAFHELVHSTKKQGRCDRDNGEKVSAFGSDKYTREELVAEIGSAMLCNVAGLDNEKAFKNSVSYIQGWSKQLKEDNRAIVWAAAKAEAAAKYILGTNE